jgi:hypothetical protein
VLAVAEAAFEEIHIGMGGDMLMPVAGIGAAFQPD